MIYKDREIKFKYFKFYKHCIKMSSAILKDSEGSVKDKLLLFLFAPIFIFYVSYIFTRKPISEDDNEFIFNMLPSRKETVEIRKEFFYIKNVKDIHNDKFNSKLDKLL